MTYHLVDDEKPVDEIESTENGWYRVWIWRTRERHEADDVKRAMENDQVNIGMWHDKPNFECERDGCNHAYLRYPKLEDHISKHHPGG